jgi:hypothetical protein
MFQHFKPSKIMKLDSFPAFFMFIKQNISSTQSYGPSLNIEIA